MAATKVSVSLKAKSIAALQFELDKIEAEQLRLARMTGYVVEKQMILAAKSNGLNQAIEKLLP